MQATTSSISEVKKRTLTGAVSYFARTLILQGLGIGAIFVLSVYFSPEDFAIYGFVTQIIGILIFFSDIGLAAALVQKKTEPTLSEYRTAFTLQQCLSWLIVIASMGIAATGIVQSKTGMIGLWILGSLALSFPLATLKTIPSVMLERKLQFSKLILPQIFEQLVFQIILVYGAINGFGAFAYTYAILARSVVGVLVMWWLQPWPIGLGLDLPAFKHLLGFGVKFQINDFLARIKDQLFYLILGLWLPLKEFGYVQWAKNWSMYPYNLTVQNVMAVTFPAFARLQNEPGALAKAIEKSLYFITLAIFPILVGIAIFIQPFLTLVPVYHKWLPAVASLILFSLSIAWSAISTPLTNTLNAIGQINQTLKLMLFWTGLTWLLTPILIFVMGYNGVALSALIISFTSFMPVKMVQKLVPFQFWDQIWRQTLAASAMGIIGYSLRWYWVKGWQEFALGIAACSFIYGMGLLLTGTKKLRSEVASIIIKRVE